MGDSFRFLHRPAVAAGAELVAPSAAGAQVEAEILRLQSAATAWLTFAPPLEQRFETDTAAARSHRLWTEGWAITGLFLLFAVLDFHFIPARGHLWVLLRWSLVLPWMAAANEFVRRGPPPVWRESAIVVTAGVFACSNFIAYHNISAAFSVVAQIGLLLSLLVTNVVMRLRLPYAIASTVFCIASDIAFLHLDIRLSAAEKLGCATPVILAALFLLLATYSLEREERLNYLLQLRSELQSEQLTALNRELARLSTHDSLTGLPNRGFFDRHLGMLWEQTITRRSPFSAVLIDIDHFKLVNDTQGHLYGDEVIRRVGSLIRQALRGKHDFGARYGGEEFVLLLPDTTLEAAIRVAERVRTLVQIAGSPAPQDDTPGPQVWTTVSCGVATVIDPTGLAPRQLLQAADMALYTAKDAGRNCVFAAPVLTASGAGEAQPVSSESILAGWS